MNFRSFLESGIKVTDIWPVNKAFYDMDSPEGREQYDNDLKYALARMEKRRRMTVVSEKVVEEPYVITCWRGFDQRSFERDARSGNGKIILRGERAMEGMLWFTHSLQPRDLQPKEYALSHARDDGYLLTYPLKCRRSFKITRYDDGSEIVDVPDGTKINQTELRSSDNIAGKFYELPEGWYFTWQVQRHIGFKGDLEIEASMLKKISNRDK